MVARPDFKYNKETFKIDTREFERAAVQLAYASGKDFSDIANKKLYYVARRSVWYTIKASASAIAQELGQLMTAAKGKRGGSITMKGQSQFTNRRNKDGSLESFAARLVNFYRRKAGLQGISGDKLDVAAKKFVGKRLRSIGFIKAGWIAARDSMRKKSKIIGAPEGTIAGGSKRSGVARFGDAIAAKPSKNRAYAAIWNQASYGNKTNKFTGEKYRHDPALRKYGLPAVEKAFREETADTKTQIEKAVRKSARAIGIRTN